MNIYREKKGYKAIMNKKYFVKTEDISEIEVKYKPANKIIFKGSIQDYLLNYSSIANYKPKKDKLKIIDIFSNKSDL